MSNKSNAIDINLSARERSKRQSIRCAQCNRIMFDGEYLKTRVIHVREIDVEAKCKRCGGWTAMPLVFWESN